MTALHELFDRLSPGTVATTVVDVALVYYLIYRVLLTIRGTRAAQMVVGIVLVGAAYFRQRGSYNNIASFDGMGNPPATGITPMVMQLLGINRPQVA